MTAPRRAPVDVIVFVAGPLAVAALAVWLGQSTSWDLRNYHWYNPYALLNGRMGFDAAVAHHATFYNPLIDLPLWFVAGAVPGWAAAAFLGLVQGLNFSFLYLLARDAQPVAAALRRPLAVLLATLGVTGGYAVLLTGTTYYDNVVSVPVLAALWLIVRDQGGLSGGRWLWTASVAGLLAGVAVGLKLPTAPFGLAVLAAAASASWGDLRRCTAVVFVCGIAAFAGLMAASGWWFLVLWRETGNPLFPYFNDLIGSSLILDTSYRDTRFLPATAADALLFPFRFALDWRVASDWQVNDWRVAFAYVAVPVAAAVGLSRRRAAVPFIPWPIARTLFAFAAAAYLSWLTVFAIYRYIAPLEMVAPLLIVAAIGLLPVPQGLRWAGAAIALAGAVALSSLTPGVRAPFAAHMIEVAVPPVARPDATLALMTGIEPMAFVIPQFPPAIPFLRVDGFLVTPRQPTAYLDGMIQRIRQHMQRGGDVFTLYLPDETERGDRALSALGLARTPDCTPVTSNLAPPLNWCRVKPAEAAP